MLIEKSAENLVDFPQIEADSNTNNTLIFEEISRELEEFLLRENENANSTDGIFKFLTEISNQVQEELSKVPTKNSFISYCQKYSPFL